MLESFCRARERFDKEWNANRRLDTRKDAA